MRTVIETPTFQKQAAKIWTDDERLAFIDWIAANPLVGDVIPNADGARKVRWSTTGNGKRGEDIAILEQRKEVFQLCGYFKNQIVTIFLCGFQRIFFAKIDQNLCVRN